MTTGTVEQRMTTAADFHLPLLRLAAQVKGLRAYLMDSAHGNQAAQPPADEVVETALLMAESLEAEADRMVAEYAKTL